MVSNNEQAIVLHTGGDFLEPAASLNQVLAVYQTKKDFIERVLREGVDFGPLPGGTKPSLLKPGAEKMATFFGLSPTFLDVETVEDWTGEEHGGEQFFYYRQKCQLYRGERLIGSADGSCNSWEKKYRYRQAERICPACGKSTIIKGKAEYGGGWICFAKKGGCGAKYADNDPAILKQDVGQSRNADISEQVNTILKMAQKRALVAAVLIATNASDYFTQDMEDFTNAQIVDGEVRELPRNGETRPATTPAPAAADMPVYDRMNAKVVDMVAGTLNITKTQSAKLLGSWEIDRNVTIAEAVEWVTAIRAMPLRERLVKDAAGIKDPVTNGIRGALVSLLETSLGGKTQRYELGKYLYGKASTKGWTDGEVLALWRFFQVEKDQDGQYLPSQEAVAQIQSEYTAALTGSGQENLL